MTVGEGAPSGEADPTRKADTAREVDPAREALRRKLVAARLGLPDRLERAVRLQDVLRAWLAGRREHSIGAYWPIKGEFDPLPALYRWSEGSIDGEPRRIGLPVADRAGGSLRFHVWYPGCATELDAFDIPKPKGTDPFMPTLLVVPCLGFGPGGVRLGYGGGFFARALASLQPRPVMIGVSYAHGFLPLLRLGPGDLQLDALLTEDGVMWQRS
jgi:5-formyltetrahydrofolate cyclo-ligase